MIVIISATNRTEPKTLQVAHMYARLLKEQGEDSVIVDLQDLPTDFTETALYDNRGKNETFNALSQPVKEAQKMIFVVPEYNGSFPGVLKAFIDGQKFPDTFYGKKAALVGLSDGVQGGALALSHLTDILNYCGTHVLAQRIKLMNMKANWDGEKVLDPKIDKLIAEQIRMFLGF